ncbi:MAG: hypothetical protein IPJ23_07810 [Ignavibacteriales bacterium]|nr:hypothetical protein [Ignavibacteriales bacterium]
MTKSSLPKNFALILFGIVVLLLFSNIIITKYINKDEQPNNRKTLSGIEIDKSFHSALMNFGFSDNWILKKKLKKNSGDSLFASYSVKCPKDVPIHLLLLELKNIFWENDVLLNAEEIVAGKKSILKLSSENKLKLAVEFFYDENVIREFGTVSFLVSDLPLQDDKLLNNFLKTPELFYCALIPNSDSKKHLSVLSKAGKRFALMLNDDIDELDYKLASNYSDDRIVRSIKEIVGTFYSAAFFIVDEKSDLYASKKYPYIEEQLKKRGIRIITKAKLGTLNSNSINIADNFQDFMLSVQKKDEKVLLVKAEEFITISTLIPAYRKIGYKFIYPGDIIIKR